MLQSWTGCCWLAGLILQCCSPAPVLERPHTFTVTLSVETILASVPQGENTGTCQWDTLLPQPGKVADDEALQQLLERGGPLAEDCLQLASMCFGRDRARDHGVVDAALWEPVCENVVRCEEADEAEDNGFLELTQAGPLVVEVVSSSPELAQSRVLEHLEQFSPVHATLVDQWRQSRLQVRQVLCKANADYFSALANSGMLMLVGQERGARAHIRRVLADASVNGAETVDRFALSTPTYVTLVEASARYAGFVKDGDFPALPPKVLGLKKGSKGPLVLALARRLVAEGFLPRDASGEVFDGTVIQAVRNFQHVHGIRVTGNMDRETVKALSMTAAEKLEALWRAEARIRRAMPPWEPTFLHVQVPHAFLEFYAEGRFVRRFRTVVGSARKAPPVGGGRRDFQFRTLPVNSRVDRVVVNPEWVVPDSIAEREILPNVMEDPTYLETHNYRVKTYSGGREQYVQEAGPGNALGRVKFLFPNEMGFYLHDTPAQSLFRRQIRLFSHGCIRVQYALELAQLLLERDQGITAAQIKSWLRKRKMRSVSMETPMPIHVTYHVAAADADGNLFFLKDYYDLEDALEPVNVPLSLAWLASRPPPDNPEVPIEEGTP